MTDDRLTNAWEERGRLIAEGAGLFAESDVRTDGKCGTINRAPTLEAARESMGIDWMNWREITQAIPPAYTEYIGAQLIRFIPTGICE